MKLGIDFGTSFSLPAVTVLDTSVVLLPGGKYGIPSVFYYDEWEGVLVGEAAENAGQGEEAANLKREIKLELNSTFTADGRVFTARQIVGYILNHVKENALSAARAKLINEELEGVVISVPAAFGHNEKEFIREAAETPVEEGGPGLKVLGFIKEPVAAALAYFKTSLADKTRILVYDLGGGTCDAAIVEADSSLKEKYTVIDSDMRRVGGKDWDACLETYILESLEQQSGISLKENPGYREKIKRAAVSAKHAFSEKVGEKYRDRVRARVEINGKSYQVPITSEEFGKMTFSLLWDTIEMIMALLKKNGANSVSQIICVGGSSNMPQVIEGIKKIFPQMELRVFEPEKSIAIGASIYAGYCNGKDTFLSDMAAFSYGSDCCRNYDADPNDKIVINLIQRGDRLPVTRQHRFITTRDGQTRMRFDIYESDKEVQQYDFVPGKQPVMQIVLELPPGLPKGTAAVLYLTLTTDGIIEAVADDGNGHSIKVQKRLNY